LGLIAGVLKPSEGKVVVKGKISPFLELGGSFHPELTGKENIMLNGVLLGLTRKKIIKKMDEIIEFSEIGDFIDQPIRIYSSGMLARLGFSVVAHLDPDILLIDEVLQAGDIEFQKKCFQRMWEFRKSGVTMVFVTHSMESVKTLCDRVIWFDQRTIRMDGNPRDVVSHYKSSAGVHT
jgi:lipopolysaccharide transport system ATP-binding protein